MAEYTPTTNIVRAGWVIGHSFPLTTDTDERANEFDRWLATHDAEVARRAAERGWDEGQGAGVVATVNFTPLPPNPYRAEATDTETEQ